MNAVVDLAQISFESEELGIDDIRESDAIDESVANPVHMPEFVNMQRVFTTYSAIVERGYICRADIKDIEDLIPQYPALQRLLDRYPLGSFTQEPSSVNYEVSNEGFMSSAFAAIVKALKDFAAYLFESLKRMWSFLTSTTQRTVAVDNLDTRLSAIQQYIVQTDLLLSGAGNINQDEWRKVIRRATDTEHHNLSKTWNGFRQMMIDQPDRTQGFLKSITSVINVKLPPYVEAINEFLKELSDARTEGDVNVAIAKIELFDLQSSTLVQLASSLGWNPRVQRADRVTMFQAQCNQLKNSFRSFASDRSVILDRAQFNEYLTKLTITAWGDDIASTVSWSSARTSEVMRKLNAFNSASLQPGLEVVYVQKLTPLIVAVSSNLAGFTALEAALGMLVQARDGTIRGIYKSGLELAKQLDGYVVKNKAKLTLGQNAVWHKYRKPVIDAFNASNAMRDK